MMTIETPKSFAEFHGNTDQIALLIGSIKSKSAFRKILITGITGVGKSTLARLFRAAVQCQHFSRMDDICENCRSKVGSCALMFNCAAHALTTDLYQRLSTSLSYHPSLEMPVYIFDEVHCWSEKELTKMHSLLDKISNNAVYIFTTHDPAKLPQPFISRCQIFELKPLSLRETRVLIKTHYTRLEIEFLKSQALEIYQVTKGIPREIYNHLERVVQLSHKSNT